MAKKKRRPQDLTLSNLRALRNTMARITARVVRLEQKGKQTRA